MFDCAFAPRNGKRSIAWRAHVGMMGAAQPFLSGAISKTVNMPRESTPEDIAEAYLEGWKLGLKALAIYRDGSKRASPSRPRTEKDRRGCGETQGCPRRERLPDTRQSVTHKFNIAGHEGYITVGLYEDGRPGELFITMAKEGSTIGGLMDCFGTAISMSLQYGVPLEVLVNKFSHTRFEPMGHTSNPDVRIAKSIVDYIFRWLGIQFLPGYREAMLGLDKTDSSESGDLEGEKSDSLPATGTVGGVKPGVGDSKPSNSGTSTISSSRANGQAAPSASTATIGGSLLQRAGVAPDAKLLDAKNELFASFQVDAPSCDVCGNITVRNGNCYLCHSCGNSMGCSYGKGGRAPTSEPRPRAPGPRSAVVFSSP